ncbi:type VI secretion system Vgr family protein [Chitinivorax sp. B]|uniref:type VI secretion system Vgr family protein n=1 Tax=Chitinivorax sp. B TaxID=2502235 RepID=UPI0010F9EE69|nr:type VI secretion system Vgr family protein [Chitinivorax sp. B]
MLSQLIHDRASKVLDALSNLLGQTALIQSETRLYDLDIEGIDSATLLLEAFRGVEALDALPVYELLCLSTDAHLDLAALANLQVRLLISMPDGSRQRRSGYIAQTAFVGADGGLTRYRLTVVPGVWFAHQTQQSRVFQNKSVQAIVEEVLAAYAPKVDWRVTELDGWAPWLVEHGYRVQYRETDYQFVRRLLSETGVAFRIEENEQDIADTLTEACHHRLVLFAHSHLLPEDWTSQHSLGGQGVRYHTSSSQEEQDTLTALTQTHHALLPAETQVQSWRDAGKYSNSGSSHDQGWPGEQYFPLASNQLASSDAAQTQARFIQEAQQAHSHLLDALGSVRSFRPGTWFRLTEHTRHSLQHLLKQDDIDPQYLICRLQLAGRNNLPKAGQDLLDRMLGEIPLPWASDDVSVSNAARNGDTDTASVPPTPINDLSCQLQDLGLAHQPPPTGDTANLMQQAQQQGFALAAQLLALTQPWRPQRVARPILPSALSAIVVGPQGAMTASNNQAVWTDKLGRIRVRFHWQQGHTADDKLSCWLRVLQRHAGAGRGMQFIPRIGQEVWVHFQQGDLDCPVVLGGTYNGQGEGDASYSPASRTLSQASPFTPATPEPFASAHDHRIAGQGNLQGGLSPVWHGAAGGEPYHRHAGSLLGLRSQSFDEQGHNQLRFDDSDQQLSVQLASTQYHSQLNFGHLRHYADNYRGSFRGQGIELRSDAYGAVRVGQGLLVSTYPIQHDHRQHEPAGELAGPLALLKQANELASTLGRISGRHQGLRNSAQLGVKQTAQSQLDPQRAATPALLHSAQGMVDAQDSQQALSDAQAKRTGAATAPDTTPQLTDPVLILASRGGLIATSRDSLYLAHESHSWLSGRHQSYAAGEQQRWDAGQSISVIGGTVEGELHQGIGLSLITGEDELLIQAQDSTLTLAAKGALTAESASADTTLAAPKRIVIQTAGGASLTLDGGFQAQCPGEIKIHAASRHYTGPGDESMGLPQMPGSVCKECMLKALESGSPFAMKN